MRNHVLEPTTHISVAEDICKKDGLCARICPTRVFTHREGEPPEIGDETLCCPRGPAALPGPDGALKPPAEQW
jgi:ferredoxin